jgi:two-component system, OmpR family, response regulator
MRLLLVEDDVMLASGIKLGLCGAGYAVDWVGSGERALEAVKTEAFDAAIVDLGLPKMDGLELTTALRKAGYGLPILILTARDGLHDRVQGLDNGADDYMVKPFELPELLARLAAALSSGNLQHHQFWLDHARHRDAPGLCPASGRQASH